MNEREYAYLKQKIHDLLEIDIDAYKTQQMRRRLQAYVGRQDPSNAYLFCKKLEPDEDARKELKEMLTINVSEFFRDGTQFAYFKSVVLPELLQNRPRLNIWTAGCSHGEEPYSVAMLLDELSPGRGHRILATDVDVDALARAMAGGPYQPNELKNVPKLQLRKCFTRSDEGYYVDDELRRRVQFRERNLLSDAFEQGFDLILCRNVMIYFSNETKERLFQQFQESLKPGGILFLGGTEAIIGADRAGFDRLSTNFYRRTGAVAVDASRNMAA